MKKICLTTLKPTLLFLIVYVFFELYSGSAVHLGHALIACLIFFILFAAVTFLISPPGRNA